MSGEPEVARLMRCAERVVTVNYHPTDSWLDHPLKRVPEGRVERHRDEDLILRLVPHESLEVSARVQAVSQSVRPNALRVLTAT